MMHAGQVSRLIFLLWKAPVELLCLQYTGEALTVPVPASHLAGTSLLLTAIIVLATFKATWSMPGNQADTFLARELQQRPPKATLCKQLTVISSPFQQPDQTGVRTTLTQE